MTRPVLPIAVLLLLGGAHPWAQLGGPSESGVVMGYLHFTAADLPGIKLAFGEANDFLALTKSIAPDHIDFETTDLQKLSAHLESEGITLDLGFQEIGDIGIAIAFLTDPWGSYIELTQNLAS